jgi:hypothetical protein
MAEPPFDVRRAHHWFAVECNNVAWNLVESSGGPRTPEQTDRMIHAAHAACFHWLHAGTPLNHFRALCLLATAYAAAGRADEAVRHAEACLTLSSQLTEPPTDFDLATAHGCAANAFALAGRRSEARRQYDQAAAAAGRLADEDDKQVFHRLYPAP